ncbi:MAG: hypothetical protein DI551_11940 [Micavibrio aeruginosavorus]|uniref:Stability/partitioning determinant n=1 Tax=Micavibrio aeruginosavorus TaxID=349221 RepID=A0A2W5MY12_9BACT|nr:MAG: hypothetical protein DI551_11940 [Micavibrio aeruginosavorus]
MSETKPQKNDYERAKLSFGLDDDEPAPISRNEHVEKVKEVTKKAGFLAKSPMAKEQVNTPAPVPEVRQGRKRHSTGRTVGFNTKLRPDTFEKINAFSDQFTGEEGRPVGQAEVIERAMAALEEKLKE